MRKRKVCQNPYRNNDDARPNVQTEYIKPACFVLSDGLRYIMSVFSDGVCNDGQYGMAGGAVCIGFAAA
ncbi:hypothetical protein NEIELOOT_01578 [Neisseria elongata subsp. glycolytica ATCC 29315]|uniref:Uncharacterized protein n=1 Tax=Neisseria elongata subsp. glycolytica ATCC 29315 TaxID=546263 RepID=D4DR85_NEIEG|nr:hypothetical protein NEIELOOT_01578 [Neisseria elongata subsp. glycolytica ATCC 29315]